MSFPQSFTLWGKLFLLHSLSTSIYCILFTFYSKGRSLKHVKSSKCLHTTGGWPGVDKYMVIYNGCNVKRLELWFGKQGIFSLINHDNFSFFLVGKTMSSQMGNNRGAQLLGINEQARTLLSFIISTSENKRIDSLPAKKQRFQLLVGSFRKWENFT